MTANRHPEPLTVRQAYALVMDENVNPLRDLEKPRRLQLMTVLSWMWTTIFCTSFGAWYLFDELIVGHMAVILGVLITGVTFRNASREE